MAIEEAGPSATERANETVERMGQRLGHLAEATSLKIRQGVARVQEEVEDMWAEAKSIQQKSQHKSHE